MSIPNLSTPPPWPVRYIPALEDRSADADGNPLTGIGGYAHNGAPSSILAQSPAILKTVRVSGTGTAADADYTADPDATFSEFNGVDDVIDSNMLMGANSTLEARLRFLSTGTTMLLGADGSTTGTRYYFGQNSNGAWQLGYGDGATTAGVADTEWHTFKIDAGVLYIDGIATIDESNNVFTGALNNQFWIGARGSAVPNFNSYSNCEIDYITLINDASTLRYTPSQSSNGMEDQNGTLYPNQGTGNLKANNRWTNGANYVQSGPSATIDIGTESWTSATDSALPPLSDYSVGSLGSPAPTVDYLGSPFTELYTEFDGVDSGDWIADQLDITSETGINIEIDCFLDSGNTDIGRLVSILHSNSDDIRVFSASGDLVFSLDDGTANSVTLPSVFDNEWHTVKAVFDGTTMSLSLDDGTPVTALASFDFAAADGLTGYCGASFSPSRFRTKIRRMEIAGIRCLIPNPDGSGTMIDQNGTVYANEAGTPLGTGGELRRMDYTYLHSVPKIGQGGALLQWAKDGGIDLCHMKQLAAYDNAKQYTAAEYSKNLKFVNAETEDCGTAGLVPYPIDSGDGIGSSGEWYPVDEDKVYLVEE